MTPRVSAVICTHNRASYLRKSIASLATQSVDPSEYEIVVVDNASTDSTREVVEQFSDLPNLRYLYEPVPGLSQARNTGWKNARGEYVAYLDDDAVASPDWVAGYLRSFQTFEPVPGSVGGKCEPIWEAPKPDWLSDRMLGPLSVFHWSDMPAVLSKDQWLSGCNIAYPKRALETLGGFGADLGRTGTRLLGNEENYVRRKLDARGLPSVYDPGIVVGHHVSPQRLSKDWFRRVSYGQGASDAIMLKLDTRPSRWSRAYLTLRKAMWALPRLALMLVEPSEAGRFRRECQVRQAAGYVTELWR